MEGIPPGQQVIVDADKSHELGLPVYITEDIATGTVVREYSDRYRVDNIGKEDATQVVMKGAVEIFLGNCKDDDHPIVFHDKEEKWVCPFCQVKSNE